MTPIKIAVFVIASAGIAYISRASLRSVRYHGFYRFFAWEAILSLVLLNIDYWFYQPYRPFQIVSWLCLAVSLFLVIHGLRLLRLLGKPTRERTEAPLLGLEKPGSA